MTKISDAVHLVDDYSLFSPGPRSQCGLTSGWDYFGDGEGPKKLMEGKGFALLNSDRAGAVYAQRDLHPFSGNRLTFECKVCNLSGEGLFFALGTRTESFVRFATKGETLYLGETAVGKLAYGKTVYLKAILSQLENTVTVTVDNGDAVTVAADLAEKEFTCLQVGYGETDCGSAGVYFCRLYANYFIFDNCEHEVCGKLPAAYETFGTVESVIRVEGKKDVAYAAKVGAKETAGIRVPFAPCKAKVAYEIKYLPVKFDGICTVSLLNGEKELTAVYEQNDALCADGKVLRGHHDNVWQTVRLIADARTDECAVYLNYKKVGVLPLGADTVDGIRFAVTGGEKAAEVLFADCHVWEMPDEPADYVPEPVIPKKLKDIAVGMNVCSLWDEGGGPGWDSITPFDENKPVLGYYDEGLPELADWEIKFLTEHGIDYELYCWYSSEVSAPIKSTRHSTAWLDGHMFAKYGDKEKFALLWEAANGAHPRDIEDFKNVLVPYWLDYFFADDRYMRIDNKAVMSCFGVWQVEKDMGSPEKSCEALQYLRDEVKKLGYDDLIVLGCLCPLDKLKANGFDAFHAYSWAYDGYKLSHNLDSNTASIGSGIIHCIPTMSVGFCNVGWCGQRRPLLKCSDMEYGLKYCIDTFLPQFDQNSWKSRMVHLSTWNEFGEGTFISPAGYNGFGYLDAVRNALCGEIPHEDAVPTEAQLARLSYRRAPGRHMLRRTKYDNRSLPEQERVIAQFKFETEDDLKAWKFTDMGDMTVKDGYLYGETQPGKSGYMDMVKDFNAEEIGYAKIVLLNHHYPDLVPDNARFMVNNNGVVGGVSFCSDTESLKEYVLELDDHAWWQGTVPGFRFYPVSTGNFSVKSITLYAKKPHKTLYDFEGKAMFFGDYLHELGNEPMIPLDPESGLYPCLGMHFEWHHDEQRLEFWNKQHTLTFAVGVRYAVKDGRKYELSRPPFMKDGIPTIALSDLLEMFELKCERNGDGLYLKK